ncbi:MAG: GNAT family N-acetyltransferase [Candidatus Zixiibacteriota bacterium]
MTNNSFSPEPISVPVPEALQAIRDEWEAIYKESAVRSPFLSFEYLCLWYHCFASEEAIRIIRIEDQGETVGFLPLVSTKAAGRRALSSITNLHCLHCSPLIRQDREDLFAANLYPTLREMRSSFDIIRLGPYFSFNPEGALLSEAALSRSGFAFGRTELPDFTIDLGVGFDEFYHRTISAKLRSNLKRLRKRLEDVGAGAFLHFERDAAVSNFGELLHLEDSGWKGRAESSIARLPENYQRYYRGLVRLLADQGCLHLFFLELDGYAIAGAFGYTEGDVFHWFKIGYHEDYHELTPSNLLLLDIIRYLMEHRRDLRRFHLFPGDGGYKHRWSNENSTSVEAILFSNTFRGQASLMAYRARKRLKGVSWINKLVQRVRPGA